KQKGIVVVVDYDLPKNKLGRFLVYHFTALYEPKYHKHFIKSDLEAILNKNGIEEIEKMTVLHGVGRILKGLNNKL
ncbi:MAG TPA: hypothetical protein VLB04_05805, partial [Methanotrichaceae archaeon]|nr:hypothetical protein [Methanotrichaceae archaeon]